MATGIIAIVHAPPASAAGPCTAPVTSPIACENSLAGDPESDWKVSGAGDSALQGYGTAMSVTAGQQLTFKVKATVAYHFDILRVGYYQGNGARKIAGNLAPTTYPQAQPSCLTDTASGLVDCGNWGISASWTVPANAVSGVYLAHLVRNDNGAGSLIPFVVRNDSSHSDIVVQTSDTTWQAYNTYGGNSLYSCTTPCPTGTPLAYKGAYKVSYNRPFNSANDDSGRSWLLYAEYPMIRFLESNGYDVSYLSGLDVDSRGSLLQNHKTFLSVGHDEYWSGNQRANVEAARAAGVNLCFFSGNEVFWKTRWEPSIDGTSTAGRTLVSYKETHFNAQIDPAGPTVWTGSWEDPRFAPPSDGGRPQNALTGQLFEVNSGTADIQVPAQYANLRLWRNTAVAQLTGNQVRTLGSGAGTLGYEWDVDADDGFRPAGTFQLSSTTVAAPEVFQDYGSTVAPETVTHHLTLYRAPSGALVFGAGTVQWTWGLDGDNQSGKAADPVMQQATVNLFADMGAQPATLTTGLVTASASTDTTAPTSTITSPAVGASLADGTVVTVSGTASDSGGGVVGGVEVSTNGGTTWHPAVGTTNWTYSWTVHGTPTATILTRATDDSGNIETPGSGRAIAVTCPCSLFSTAAPPIADSGDATSGEYGMKFTADSFGSISGVRFYKSTANTGTHVANLWTASGTRLATATFTNETASGWQSVQFAQPVPISANTTYVVSYLAPKGHYAQTEGYFYPPPSPAPDGGVHDTAPLHGVLNVNGASNGMYLYTAASQFPTNTFNAENYWVDPMYAPSPAPGQVTGVTANAQYAAVAVGWNAPAGSAATSYTVTPYVNGVSQPSKSVTGLPAPTSLLFTGLTNGTTYTFTVTAANPNGSGPESTQSAPATPSASASAVQNGGFESGAQYWTATGAITPTVTTAKPHTGTSSALLGATTGSYPAGDSSMSQTISVPPSQPKLTFWYQPGTADTLCSGSCTFDWEEAQIRDTSGTTLASIFKSNSNSQAWTQVTFDLSAYSGQTVVLYFNVHNDASSPPDDSWMYLDDIAVTSAVSTAPSAPSGVSATAGNASATVTWTAPANGGATITSYTVTPYIGGAAQPATVVSGNPAPVSANVAGLTNGTAYTFTVTATNSVGTSPASGASAAVTPSAPQPPGVPTGVSATAGNASATVSWTAPSNNGSVITSYTVIPYLNGVAQTATTVPGNPPATSTAVNGLTNGSSYTFTVSATNANGSSTESAASGAVTPVAPPAPTAPSAPTGVTATAGNASATVSWTAPSNGGAVITSYAVTPYAGASALATTTVTGSPPATTAAVTGLTNGTAYTFKVTATNSVGTGASSAASNAITPSAPTGPTFVQQASARATATKTTVVPGSNITLRDRLVVLVGVWSSANATAKTVTDSAGNTYTKLTSFKTADQTEMSVWTAPVTAGGGTRPTLSVTPTAKADTGVSLLEYAGMSTAAGAAAVDKLVTASGTTGAGAATVSSGATAAATADGEIALGFYADSGFSNTLTAGPGWTQRANVSPVDDMDLLVEDQTVALGGTPAATIGTGANTPWLAATIVFKHA